MGANHDVGWLDIGVLPAFSDDFDIFETPRLRLLSQPVPHALRRLDDRDTPALLRQRQCDTARASADIENGILGPDKFEQRIDRIVLALRGAPFGGEAMRKRPPMVSAIARRSHAIRLRLFRHHSPLPALSCR
jgi:hypothetical protein